MSASSLDPRDSDALASAARSAFPNGRLADSRIESYAARDRMRLATTITA